MTKNLLTWAEINLDNLSHNIKEIQQFTNNTEILAIVKAQAYGHGIVEVSQAAFECGTSNFGVATLQEAIILRQSNTSANVIILAPTLPINYEYLLEYNLTQTIINLDYAKELSKVALKMGKIATIHIKIDTGLGRLGFKPTKKSISEIISISEMKGLKLEAVFSHLAMSEEGDTSFTYEQYERFLFVTEALSAVGISFKRHISNSGAIINNRDLNLDMVRPGAILYGVFPSINTPKHIDLKPVMSVKGKVVFINTIKVGESIGYDRTYYAKNPTTVGIIMIGYADGYSSDYSNKSYVTIKGIQCNILGIVCMDQIIVDVTNVPNIQIGDIAHIFGDEGPTITDLTTIGSVKAREIQCLSNIGKRIPRVYIKNGTIYKTVNL